MIAVQKYLDDGNIGAAQLLLSAYLGMSGEEDIRGWEWRYLWKKALGSQETNLQEHADAVTSVVFSPNGKLVASGSMDQSVIISDQDGKELAHLMTDGPINTITFSHDGRYLAAGNKKGNVTIWDAKTFELFREIRDAEDGGAFVAFSPCDSTLAVGYGSGMIRLWDYSVNGTDVWLGIPHDHYPDEQKVWTDSEAGCDVAFSSDGRYIAKYGAGTGQFEVWEVKSLELVASHQNSFGATGLDTLTFVSGTNLVFSSHMNKRPVLWDFESDSTHFPVDDIAGQRIVQGVFSANGELMVTAGLDHSVRLWEISGTLFHERARLLGHRSEVRSVSMSSDGSTVVSGGQDRDVLLWTVDQKKQYSVISESLVPCTPRFSQDGQLVALASSDQRGLRSLLYDLHAGHFLDIEPNGYPVHFTSHGNEIVTCNFTGGSVTLSNWSLAKSRMLWEAELKGTPMVAPSGAMSVCENLGFAAGGAKDGSVTLVDYLKGRTLNVWKAHNKAIANVAFSPDGKWILTSEVAHRLSEDSTVLWSCADVNVILPHCSLQGHERYIQNSAFSPDSTIVATAGADRRIMLWDTKTGTLQRELLGHKQGVFGIDFSGDGKTLASASNDGTVKLWQVATGRELVTLELDSSGIAVKFSPDGDALAVLTGSDPWVPEELNIWRIPSLEEIEQADGLHGRKETADLPPSSPENHQARSGQQTGDRPV
jgi:WD40 repeat protein